MEIPQAHKHPGHLFVGEMFGAMMLVFAVCAQSVFTFGIFGIGMSLFGSILLFGNITGGNYNPAVTLGVFIANFKDMGRNIIPMLISTTAQFVGAFCGIMLAAGSLITYSEKDSDRKSYAIAILEPAGSGPLPAFASEVACTFFFILIILMVKHPKLAPSKEGYLCCWTVGITLISCICLCASHSGAALNPAVGLAVNIYDGWQLATSEYYQYMWIYICGPYLGGALAGVFHHYHHWSTMKVLGEEEAIREAEQAMLKENLTEGSAYELN